MGRHIKPADGRGVRGCGGERGQEEMVVSLSARVGDTKEEGKITRAPHTTRSVDRILRTNAFRVATLLAASAHETLT